jgi:hypothetical protein
MDWETRVEGEKGGEYCWEFSEREIATGSSGKKVRVGKELDERVEDFNSSKTLSLMR